MEEEKYGKLLEKKEEDKEKNFICIYILVFIPFTLCFITSIYLLLTIKPSDEIIKKFKGGFIENWSEYYGIKLLNLSYSNDDKIKNTFAKGEINFDSKLNSVNLNLDYEKIPNNNYDIYIPYSSLENKKNKNGIFFFLHGGFYISGNKKEIEYLCIRYAKLGYITVNIEYSLLTNNNNIFRIMDEISSAIESTKKKLEELNFENLVCCLGGISTGAHLALLYSYWLKSNSKIPIEFVINFSGNLNLDLNNFYINKGKNILEGNLTLNQVENYKTNKSIIPLSYHIEWIKYINAINGNIFKDNELNKALNRTSINFKSETFKSLEYIINKTSIIKYINKDTIPTLSLYGGKDKDIGILHYFILKEKLKENNVEHYFSYMKYSDHKLYPENEEDLNKTRAFHSKILSYAKKYFN